MRPNHKIQSDIFKDFMVSSVSADKRKLYSFYGPPNFVMRLQPHHKIQFNIIFRLYGLVSLSRQKETFSFYGPPNSGMKPQPHQKIKIITNYCFHGLVSLSTQKGTFSFFFWKSKRNYSMKAIHWIIAHSPYAFNYCLIWNYIGHYY